MTDSEGPIIEAINENVKLPVVNFRLGKYDVCCVNNDYEIYKANSTDDNEIVPFKLNRDDNIDSLNDDESLTIEGPGSMNGYVSQSDEFYSAKSFSINSDTTLENEQAVNDFKNYHIPNDESKKNDEDKINSQEEIKDYVKKTEDKLETQDEKQKKTSKLNDLPQIKISLYEKRYEGIVKNDLLNWIKDEVFNKNEEGTSPGFNQSSFSSNTSDKDTISTLQNDSEEISFSSEKTLEDIIKDESLNRDDSNINSVMCSKLKDNVYHPKEEKNEQDHIKKIKNNDTTEGLTLVNSDVQQNDELVSTSNESRKRNNDIPNQKGSNRNFPLSGTSNDQTSPKHNRFQMNNDKFRRDSEIRNNELNPRKIDPNKPSIVEMRRKSDIMLQINGEIVGKIEKDFNRSWSRRSENSLQKTNAQTLKDTNKPKKSVGFKDQCDIVESSCDGIKKDNSKNANHNMVSSKQEVSQNGEEKCTTNSNESPKNHRSQKIDQSSPNDWHMQIFNDNEAESKKTSNGLSSNSNKSIQKDDTENTQVPQKRRSVDKNTSETFKTGDDSVTKLLKDEIAMNNSNGQLLKRKPKPRMSILSENIKNEQESDVTFNEDKPNKTHQIPNEYSYNLNSQQIGEHQIFDKDRKKFIKDGAIEEEIVFNLKPQIRLSKTNDNNRRALNNSDICDAPIAKNRMNVELNIAEDGWSELNEKDINSKDYNTNNNPVLACYFNGNDDVFGKSIYENEGVENNEDVLARNVVNAMLVQSHNVVETCEDLNCVNSMEDQNISTVASVTTSVVDAPSLDKTLHTLKERRNSKFGSDSIEYDSLNSDNYISTGSGESLDKLGMNRNNRGSVYSSKTLPASNDVQTCGKCCEDIKNKVIYNDIDSLMKNDDIYLNDSQKGYACNLKGVQLSKDLFYVQNEKSGNLSGSENGSKTSQLGTPRSSQQMDDKPDLTEMDLEKRSSLFRKMSTLPLDLPEKSDGKDSNRKCLLEDESTRFDWKRLLAQILAVSAKNTLAFNFGMSVGFQTIAIPSLEIANNDLHLEQDQISLYGSLFFTAIPLGCLLSGPTIHGWGRKPAMLVFCLPLFISWWIYYFAMSPAVLYLAIIIMGLVNGLLEAPILTYVAEVTEARWRGMLASSSIVAALLGVFSQMLLGNIFSWRMTAVINSLFPIISFISICFVPESPHWLASKGRKKEVEKSLMWLRGWVDKSSVADEVESLMKENAKKATQSSEPTHPLSWRSYRSRTFLEPFFIVIGSFFFGHFSGMATVQTYSVRIFDTLGVKGWSWTAAMGGTQVLGATACVIALPLVGKRPIAVVSMVGVAVGMAGAALSHGTLAASSLLLANISTNACSRVIPWVLIGEVFTNEMRAVASGLSSCICYVMAFILSYTYLRVEAALTLRILLGIYASVGLAGSIAYYAFLPETEGKSLAQVQHHFSSKSRRLKPSVSVDNPAFQKEQP